MKCEWITYSFMILSFWEKTQIFEVGARVAATHRTWATESKRSWCKTKGYLNLKLCLYWHHLYSSGVVIREHIEWCFYLLFFMSWCISFKTTDISKLSNICLRLLKCLQKESSHFVQKSIVQKNKCGGHVILERRISLWNYSPQKGRKWELDEFPVVQPTWQIGAGS